MNEAANIRFSKTIVCRLCLNQDPFALDIFSKFAESKEIQDKIRLCLPRLKISEDDALPKHVCFRCLYKLELTSDFMKQCILAQSVLTKTSHGHEGEPLAKARKTSVFSSLSSSEQDVNGITLAESDSSFDDLDIHSISNGFKESHLNGNMMTIQAYTQKEQDKVTLFDFNGAREQCGGRSPNLKKSSQLIICNWKNDSTHFKRAPCATADGENSFDNPADQLPQEFLHNSYFKSDTGKSIETHKWKGYKRTEDYLHLGNNKHNALKDTTQKSSPLQKQNMYLYLENNKHNSLKDTTQKSSPLQEQKMYLYLENNEHNGLNDTTQKSSPLQKQKISSPISFMRQLPSGSINQVDTHIDNDSDEEINQHIKIFNSLRNKCPL